MLELNRYICTRSTVFVDVDDGVVAGVLMFMHMFLLVLMLRLMLMLMLMLFM